MIVMLYVEEKTVKTSQSGQGQRVFAFIGDCDVRAVRCSTIHNRTPYHVICDGPLEEKEEDEEKMVR